MTPVALPFPVPVVKQSGQVIFPFTSKATTPLADTATVPDALGIVIILFPAPGAAKTKEFVTPADVSVREVTAPCSVRFWDCDPIVNAPDGVIALSVPEIPPIESITSPFIVLEEVGAVIARAVINAPVALKEDCIV